MGGPKTAAGYLGDPARRGEDEVTGEITLDERWDALWADLRRNATGEPSGRIIIAAHRPAIEAEAREAVLDALWEQVGGLPVSRRHSDDWVERARVRQLLERFR